MRPYRQDFQFFTMVRRSSCTPSQQSGLVWSWIYLLLYCQVLEQLICLLTVVRHLPAWSCMVIDLPCFSIVRFLSNWYAFLLLWDTTCLVLYDNGSALLLYCQVLEQLTCLLTVVRHLPLWSCMIMDLPCFSILRSLSNWYAFLLLWDTSLSGLVW